MSMHGLIGIRDYRVRLPKKLFPYRGKAALEVRPAAALGPADPGWLPVRSLGEDFFRPAFPGRNPFNVPGPFYGADTDTCGTGPPEAPGNVLLDPGGQEFLSKQPADAAELRDVLSAALCECVGGYGGDGDGHWTLPLIREWWGTHSDLLAAVGKVSGDPGGVRSWQEFLSGLGEGYLRAYAFFVEERRLPADGDTLPDVRGRPRERAATFPIVGKSPEKTSAASRKKRQMTI
jgi:hypothetical protein